MFSLTKINWLVSFMGAFLNESKGLDAWRVWGEVRFCLQNCGGGGGFCLLIAYGPMVRTFSHNVGDSGSNTFSARLGEQLTVVLWDVKG